MTLTWEQYNKLATKQDLNDLRGEMLDTMVSKREFHNVMDYVVKKLDNIEHSFVSNLSAHDRFEQKIAKLEAKS